MTSHWHLAQLKPNSLKRAMVNLDRQGFETFLPLLPGIKAAQPLFPGYVFVRFDTQTTQWRAIGSTYGVARLVATRPNQPDRVPAQVMQALRARCNAEGVLLPPQDIAPGDQVRILEGPLAGWVTEVTSLGKDERVMVLLSLIGKETRTSVPLRALQKL